MVLAKDTLRYFSVPQFIKSSTSNKIGIFYRATTKSQCDVTESVLFQSSTDSLNDYTIWSDTSVVADSQGCGIFYDGAAVMDNDSLWVIGTIEYSNCTRAHERFIVKSGDWINFAQKQFIKPNLFDGYNSTPFITKLSNNRIVIPLYSGGDRSKWKVVYTDDYINFDSSASLLIKSGAPAIPSEAALIELKDSNGVYHGHVKAIIRSEDSKYFDTASSFDYCATWDSANADSALFTDWRPCPPYAARSLNDSTLVLITGDSYLYMFVSTDEGCTWKRQNKEIIYRQAFGKYYSSIIPIGDADQNKFLIAYSCPIGSGIWLITHTAD
jgi:hypothetical protein